MGEMMGVMSFLLISWFNGRQLARNGAFLAFNINRLGDLFLFFRLLFGFVYFIVLSLLTKSSMWIFSTWLPNAMEGPTPVSALLHSSTMVVAGGFLVQFFNFLCFHIILVYVPVHAFFKSLCLCLVVGPFMVIFYNGCVP